MTRPDHRDSRLGEHFGITSHVKDERRIVDFFQPWGIRQIVKRKHPDFRSGATRNLFARQFRRLARSQ
jgi:hypothetical protein